MPHLFARLAFTAIVAAMSVILTTSKATAQTYQIDCAILLCLSGGWPASVPCTRARAEFIRRITPWPVEPPLQIWRCPIGASHQHGTDIRPRFFDILFDDPSLLPQSFPKVSPSEGNMTLPALLRRGAVEPLLPPTDLAWRLVQDRADIDISGPEFNFVRSIRVYDVRYARQHESGRDDDCNRSANIRLGTYGMQGDFSWARSSPTALPEAHIGLDRWGQNCPSIYHRSVFVEWRDYAGNYGFEQVNY
ncbi:MAG: hypothetical protein P1U83_17080 [Roseovarius sp.]|nr:hypothetical protein [Roseovarius sp.]